MANDNKKPARISIEAHDALREFCERTGRNQGDVLTELLYRFVRPEVEGGSEPGTPA